ncbi:MAG: FAD-dependent oxidoreductase [Rhodospirillaceae bacterium]|nr:FAD-dependent oxidoreductase [Rhodospirillaceae bacterium]
MSQDWDVIIIGAGTAGLPAAIFAAERSDRILVLDAAPEIGGTLHLSSGQMSGAGTRLQKEKGYEDSPAQHIEDIMRISKNTADREIAGLAVDNAAETLDWIESINFRPLPEHPVKGQAHEPYSVNRYVWGESKGKAILAVLRPLFEKLVKSGKVTLKLNTRASELVQNSNGAITGVIAQSRSGSTETHMAGAVLIAAGGYVANGAMYKELSGGHPAYGDHSYPYCIGDGLKLGLDAGGTAWGHKNYLTSFGCVMQSYDVPSKVRWRQIHWPERRMPWEIYVNAHGKRFIREDEPSVDVREHTIQDQPGLRHWIVFDSETLREAPALFADVSASDIQSAAEKGEPMFYVAGSIAALAEKAGLPATTLEETVNSYNIGQASEKDSFGREIMPRPITDGPFYAIRSQAMSVSSTVGLKVNTNLEVVRGDGSPVIGLYAAGESLGQGAMMGSSFCGGMLVTPALTFGKMLGQRLLPIGDPGLSRSDN